MLQIEVVYALPARQTLLQLTVPAGSTIESAIRASGVLQKHPDINLKEQQVGIFGEIAGLTRILRDGDRVEIYRPLLVDPKEHRRRRARISG